MSTARVTDEHLAVPASVVDPVVVSFDGQYVWSFWPRRDGSRAGDGWRVPWPEVLAPRLEGTAHVRLSDVDGGTVHFEGHVAFGGGTEPLDLSDEHGHPLAVDKAGHLIRVFAEVDHVVRRHILEGTARAVADLRDRVGVDAHVTYGCLLGAVRDGRMIGHDSDTDLGYLSRHTHPADVVRESMRIERELRELGWKVVRMSGADLKLFLPLPDGRDVQVDVFAGFHVGDVFYLLGGRSGTLPRSALTPASTVVLEGVELVAPADPEAVLAFLYGPSWRVPDPAFVNVDPAPGVRRLDGWVRGFRTHIAEWNDVFRDRFGEIPRRGSPFAAWARSRMPAGAVVVDVGSGSARDTVWFHRRGHRVVAVDYAGGALRRARGRLRHNGVEAPDVRVLVLNDVRSVLLLGAELAREPEPAYLYARGLVECLDADGRQQLWRLGSMALRRGGALFLEYAAARADLPESGLDGLATRLDTGDLVAGITAAGGSVVHQEHLEAPDFLGRPDPYVARLEVRWTPDPEETAVRPETITEGAAPRRRGRVANALLLPQRLRDLEAAVQENRRLNRRVAELTDIVAELLVPLAERDEEKARELLARFRETTLGP